ncbi:MAG: allophanate hydrolase [Opitutales bacterium]
MLQITSLLSDYRAGTRTPREVLTSLVEKIKSSDNPKVWIYALSLEEIEPWIARLEGASPDSLPLYGVPFAIKDNIDLAGIPTTAACPEYAYTPEKSATVVENLIAAGAVPLGKTNLDQFATGLVGVRTPYGTPVNPIAPDRVPGGSSCGSAVALSEGFVSFSLGTDTAGSGRVPAVFNKLWGVKPSRGRLSNTGLVPACKTLDCISIFAFDAEGAKLALSAAEGFDESDAYSQPVINKPVPTESVLGIPQPDQLMFFGDAQYDEAWVAAKAELKAKGWTLREVDFSPFIQAARLLYEGPWVSERYAAIETFLKEQPESVFPVTRQIISGGGDHSARDAFVSTYKLAELKRKSEAAWEGVAAIVTPTVGGFPTLEDMEKDPVGPNSQLGYFTNFMNLLDLSALAVPAGEAPSGLPFGITYIAPRDSDQALLEIASKGPVDTSMSSPETVSIILFGAHMSGLPLNTQVLGLGGTFVGEVKTAEKYKMVYLPEPKPHRPGIVKIGEGGVSIACEEWSFPAESVGAFLASISTPLGLGQIELSDGRYVHGFLCEPYAADAAEDISSSEGWRAYLAD